jgi:type I restriction enzyme, S subunit
MAGGGKGNLNSGELERFRVKLPPIEEQRRIAKLLAGWDVAIEKAEQLIAVKERRHAGLLQLLITSIPARHHWATIEFGSVVTERTQKTTTHDQHPVLTSSRRGLLLQSEYFSRQVTSENNTAYKVMRHGDFTFRSMSDDGRFVFNRLTTIEAGVISPAYGVFYATDCYPEFLAHFLNSSYFANALNRESQGGTRKALKFSSIAKAETDFPSVSEQKRIAIILDASREDIDIYKQRQTLFREQKRSLMQRLFTGQWRVPVKSWEATA